MTRLVALAALLTTALVLTACEPFGDKDKENLNKACGTAPPALSTMPVLPGAFPAAKGLTLTSVEKDGPSTVVRGYTEGTTIGDAHTLFSTTLKNAPGYQVTHEEQDAADSEVNFAGHGQSGQVKMVQGCKDRTTVTITIRPS